MPKHGEDQAFGSIEDRIFAVAAQHPVETDVGGEGDAEAHAEVDPGAADDVQPRASLACEVHGAAHVFDAPGGVAEEVEIEAAVVQVGLAVVVEVETVVHEYRATVPLGVVLRDENGVGVESVRLGEVAVEGGDVGFGERFGGFKMEVHNVAVVGDLCGEGLFVVEDEHLGEGAGGAGLDQIGDLVPQSGERFSEPPDDALGAAVEVYGDFGVVCEEDFHGSEMLVVQFFNPFCHGNKTGGFGLIQVVEELFETLVLRHCYLILCYSLQIL